MLCINTRLYWPDWPERCNGSDWPQRRNRSDWSDWSDWPERRNRPDWPDWPNWPDWSDRCNRPDGSWHGCSVVIRLFHAAATRYRPDVVAV